MGNEDQSNEPLIKDIKIEGDANGSVQDLQDEFQQQRSEPHAFSPSLSVKQQEREEEFEDLPSYPTLCGAEMSVNTRWNDLCIEDVFDVRIENIERYNDDQEVKQSGLFVGKKKISRRGMLKSADLTFSVRLPVRIDRESLTVRVTESPIEVFSSFVTEVQFGVISETQGQIVSSTREDAVQTASVTIPLVRELSQTIPIFDQINYHGKHVLHRTIEVLGFDNKAKKFKTFFIRTKIAEAEGTAEITSVSTSFVDTVRVAENWNSFKTACGDFGVWMRNLFSRCKGSRKSAATAATAATTTDSNTALEFRSDALPATSHPQIAFVSPHPSTTSAAPSFVFSPSAPSPSGAAAAPAGSRIMTPVRIHGTNEIVLVPVDATRAAQAAPSSFVAMHMQ